MKILSLCNMKPDKFGGFERYLIGFSKFLAKKGHEHHIWFCCEPISSVKDALLKSGAKYRVIDDQGLGFKNSVAYALDINKAHYDILHIHFYPYNSFLSFLLSFTKIKQFFTYHISGAPAETHHLKKILKRIRTQIIGVGVNKVFCVSEYNRNKFINDFQVSYSKTQLIYNGVELEDNRPKIDKHADHLPVIITVGYLIEEKGVQYLIQAMALLKKIKCNVMIVGGGPYKSTLEKYTVEYGVKDKISFLGVRNDVPDLLQQADIAVIPSIWQEACAYTVIESAAAGLPIVATRVGGNPELVHEGYNGFIVEAHNANELADKLKLLLDDRQLREKMAQNSRQLAEVAFDIQRVFQQQLDAFIKN